MNRHPWWQGTRGEWYFVVQLVLFALILLANYQNNPRGERAADSLYYLGHALTRLNRRPVACRVYDELVQVYSNMRDEIRRRLPQARNDAHCPT